MGDWRFNENDPRCPSCNQRLYKKYDGYTCKNWKCFLQSKYSEGWFYKRKTLDKTKFFHIFEYENDFKEFENIKKWLKLKSEKLYENRVCYMCKSKNMLDVHHILPRHKHPELTFDYENLMVLCEQCHKKIHEGDRHRF